MIKDPNRRIIRDGGRREALDVLSMMWRGRSNTQPQYPAANWPIRCT
jgi:hypothetical protein